MARGKPWTPEEDDVIRWSLSLRDAAQQLGRTYAAVRKRASRIAARRHWTKARVREWNDSLGQPTHRCWLNEDHEPCPGWMIYNPDSEGFWCSKWYDNHSYLRNYYEPPTTPGGRPRCVGP